MAEDEQDEEPAGDVPQWLSAAQPVAQAGTPGDDFEWMSEETEQDDNMPEWLGEAEPQSEMEDDLDWMAEDDEEALAAGDLSEWLSAAQPEASGDDEAAFADEDWLQEIQAAQAQHEDQTPVVTETTGEFGWIDAINAPEQAAHAEAELEGDVDEMNFSEPEREIWFDEDDGKAEAVALGDSAAPDDFQPEYELTETAHAPASNAPDWLNAMVPGLDVDFDAKEDEPVEQDYISGETRRKHVDELAPRPAFDWLLKLVDTEINQSAARRKQVYSFSRQPAWLRTPVEKRDPALQNNDDDPFGDFDLFDDDAF
jgi:hypothetical protein